MRVALFGSPQFAVPILDALFETGMVVAVVTQPARPAHRGLKLLHPPLAIRAMELGLELRQPTRLKGNAEFHGWLAGLELDAAITAAYGRILPQSLLDLPREGFLNAHASLLPRWRGAAPIQWALISGDTETGISVMQTEAGLDTGPVRLTRRVQIAADETAPELFSRLSGLAAPTVLEALELLERGELESEEQDPSLVTIAPLLTRADGRLDFLRTAEESFNRYRGVAAWPGTFFPHSGADIKVGAMSLIPEAAGRPGEVLELSAAGMLVACRSGGLLLGTLQSPGRRQLPARDWANGVKLVVGDSLLSPGEDI